MTTCKEWMKSSLEKFWNGEEEEEEEEKFLDAGNSKIEGEGLELKT